MENSYPYTPLDLSTIKKPKINNESALEAEITKISDILKDTSNFIINSHLLDSTDWKKRTEFLKKI